MSKAFDRSKAALFRMFKGNLSSGAVQKRDGQAAIVGRHVVIHKEGRLLDVWLCNTRNMAAGLSGKMLNSRMELLKDIGDWHTANGEAWVKCRNPLLLVPFFKQLGVRRKRVLSEDTKAAMSARAKARYNKEGLPWKK